MIYFKRRNNHETNALRKTRRGVENGMTYNVDTYSSWRVGMGMEGAGGKPTCHFHHSFCGIKLTKGGVPVHFSFSGRQWVPELGDQSSSFFLSLHVSYQNKLPTSMTRFGTNTNIFFFFFFPIKIKINKYTEHNNLINDTD